MYQIPISEHGHQWEKINLVTQSDKKGCFDKYKCKYCSLEGKSYQLGVIQLKGSYARDKVYKCLYSKLSQPDIPKRIRIINFEGFGRVFGNIINGSEHDVVDPPRRQTNDNSGVWVMGVGEPVRILKREYEVVN